MTMLTRPANKDWHRGWIPGVHRGQDFGWGNGDQIYAAAPGTVTSVYAGGGWNGGWGNRIEITHASGVITAYCHMWNHTIYVKVGDRVKAGQHIADMGSTGDSDAKHLHFELWLSGVRVDPQPYYTQHLPGTDAPPPPVPPGAERRWNSDSEVAFLRKGPGTGYEIVGEVAGNDYGDFDAWTRGQPVNGNNVWLRGAYSGYWSWAGSYTDTTAGKLPEIPFGSEPAPEPENPRPEYKPRDVTTLVEPGAEDFPAWIQYDEVLDSDEARDPLEKNLDDWAYYWDQYQQDQPYWPEESHVHWWGSPTAGDTHDGIVDYLGRAVDKSADFVTSPGRITRMGSIRTASYTTGARSMYAWTSENDPKITLPDNPDAELGYKTLGYLHYIMEVLNPELRGQPIRLHKEFAATACSNIDPARVRAIAEDFHAGRLDPATGEKPKPQPPDPKPGVPWYIVLLGGIAAAIAAAIAAWMGTQV